VASLADCIRKAGKALDGKDRDALEAYLAHGADPASAVDAVVAELDMQQRQVARQAGAAGAAVAPLEAEVVQPGNVPLRQPVDTPSFVTDFTTDAQIAEAIRENPERFEGKLERIETVMTPQEFLARVQDQFGERDSMEGVEQDVVDGYVESMRNGDVFPAGFLGYVRKDGATSNDHGGRHRALAAIEAGVESMPVVVVRNATGEVDPRSEVPRVAQLPQRLDQGVGHNGGPSMREPSVNGQDEDGNHPFRISTRQAAGPRATENPLEDNLVIGVEQFTSLPEAPEGVDPSDGRTPGVGGTKTRAAFLAMQAGGFKPTVSWDNPDQVIEEFIAHVKENLLWIHNNIDPEIRERSRRWYDGARALTSRWADRFGIPDHAMAGVFAALSPQKDWFENISLAERVVDLHFNVLEDVGAATPEMIEWAEWKYGPNGYVSEIYGKQRRAKAESAKANKRGRLARLALPEGDKGRKQTHAERKGRFESRGSLEDLENLRRVLQSDYASLTSTKDRAMWLRAYDEAHNERGHRVLTPEGDFIGEPRGTTSWNSYGEMSKALAVLDDMSFEGVSAAMGDAHKVRNFYNNILSPNNDYGDVTIDTHAIGAGLMLAVGSSAAEVLKNFGGFSSQHTGIRGIYGIYAEAYRQAAAEADGGPILPRQIQSITWEAIRTAFPADWKTDANQAAVRDMWDNGATKTSAERDDVRQAILDLAGGVFPAPEWANPDDAGAAADASPGDSSYANGLGRVREGGGRPYTGGDRGLASRDGVAAGVPARLNQFAGEQARNVPPGAARAEEMLDQGRNAAYVQRETGWTRGADGYMRFEIDDSQATLSIPEPVKDPDALFGDPGRIHDDLVALSEDIRGLLRPHHIAAMLDETGWNYTSNPRFVSVLRISLTDNGWEDGPAGAFAKEIAATMSLRNMILSGEQPTTDQAAQALAAARDSGIGSKRSSAPLDKVLDHPRLFEAYPSLRDITVEVRPLPGNTLGQWNVQSQTLVMSPKLAEPEMLTTVLHEVQHAIQSLEGFAQGGNSSPQMKALAVEAYKSASSAFSHEFDSWMRVHFGDVMPEMMDAYEAKALETVHNAHLYGDMLKLREYVARDKLTTVGRHVRGLLEWAHHPEFRELDPQLTRDLSAWGGSAPKRRSKDYNEWLRRSSLRMAAAIETRLGPSWLATFESDPRTVRTIQAAASKAYGAAVATVAPGRALRKKHVELQNQLHDVKYASSYELYHRLAGEVEARATQARMHLNAAERREAPVAHRRDMSGAPRATEDVARDDQFVVWHNRNVALPAPAALNQPKPVASAPEARGYYEPAKRRIVLGRGKDKSTFLHESAHYFLEVMRDAQTIDPSIANDLAAAETWFRSQGAKDERTRHELFASGFETYLMEGRAPSRELASVFNKFRAWLMHLYRNLLRSSPFGTNKLGGAELNDPIREVFDRMLATDDAILAAREAAGQRNELPLDGLGLDDDARAQVQDAMDAAAEEATAQLTVEMMKDLQRDTTAYFKDVERRRQADAAAELERDRDVVTWDFLTSGQVSDRFSAATAALDGTDAFKLNASQVRALTDAPRSRRMNRLTAKDGVDIDIAASVLGYSSGAELVEAMANTMTKAERKAYAKAEGTRRAKAEVSEMDDDTIRTRAAAAVHADQTGESLVRQIAALRRQMGSQEQPGDIRGQLRAAAEAATANVPLRSLRLGQIQRQEQKWGDAAVQAAARGDAQATLEALTRQAHQHYIWKAAKAQLEQAEKSRALAKSMRRGVRYDRVKASGDIYKNALDTVLAVFDFRRKGGKPVDVQALRSQLLETAGFANPETPHDALPEEERALRRQEEREDAQAFGMDIPGLTALLDQDQVHYLSLTGEQLATVHQALEMLEGASRSKAFMLAQGRREALEVAQAKLLRTMELNAKHAPKVDTFGGEDLTVLEKTRAVMDGSLTISNLVRMLDGYQDDGDAWRLIGQPLQDAAVAESEMLNAANEELGDLFDRYYGARAQSRMKAKTWDENLGTGISKNDALTVLLNWGTESNRQRVRDGWGFTDQQVEYIFGKYIDQSDVEFAQGAWSMLEGLWPQTAQLHRDMYGFTPPRVELTTFEVNGQVVAGGYFPIKYDPKQSAKAEEHALTGEHHSGDRLGAKPKHGAAQARVARVKGRPLRSDVLGVMTAHLTDTLHHVTHDRALFDVGRLLSNDDVKTAMQGQYGEHVYDYLTRRIRQMRDGASQLHDMQDALLTKVRNNATIAMLGASMRTTALQVFGVTNSVVRMRMSGIGVHSVVAAYARMSKNPAAASARAQELSGMMRTRMNTQSMALQRIRNRIQTNGGITDGLKQAVMFPIVQSQYWGVDLPTWMAAFDHASSLGKSDDNAAKWADQVVRTAQGGGGPMDTTTHMDDAQGGPWRKLFTNFLTYTMTTYSLQVENNRRTGLAMKADDASALDKMAAGYNWSVNTFVTMSVPAILNAMLGAWVAGDDEDTPFEERLVREQVGFFLGMNILTAQLSGMAQGFDYSGPQGLSVIPAFTRLVKQAQQGEADQAAAKAAIQTIGLLFGLPTTQINRSIFGYIHAQETGADVPSTVKQVLFGPER
jgi:hypothetical protein